MLKRPRETLSVVFPPELKLTEQDQDQKYDKDEADNSRRAVPPRAAMAPRGKSTD